MNHFTNRQIIMLCALSVGLGALFSPPLKSVAQPPESQPEGSASPNSVTPQPLATPTASAPSAAFAAAGRTTNAIGPITGQGTTDTIAKFTAPNVIGNSVMFEKAGKIGIGTTNPSSPLSVLNAGSGNAVLGSSSSGIGLYGLHSATSGTQPGVQGETSSVDAGAFGLVGQSNATNAGGGSAGVFGINKGTNGNGQGV